MEKKKYSSNKWVEVKLKIKVLSKSKNELKIEIEGTEYTIVSGGVKRDPAAASDVKCPSVVRFKRLFLHRGENALNDDLRHVGGSTRQYNCEFLPTQSTRQVCIPNHPRK